MKKITSLNWFECAIADQHRLNIMKKILLSLLLVLFGSAAHATDNSVPIRTLAFDDNSCGAWIKSASVLWQRQTFMFWFRGFASGYNYALPNKQISNMPNNETLALYIDKFCRENPLSPFTGAAFNLIGDLKKQ